LKDNDAAELKFTR